MKYENILNKIYSNYKTETEYSNIKFIKENNTNIVKYEINNPKYKISNGIIVEQNHIVLINFDIKNETNNYTIFSKARISQNGLYYHALIYNCLIDGENIVSKQTIGRYFQNRRDLYKRNKDDIVVNENVFDECYDEIIDISKDSYTYKKGYKL